MPSKWLLSFPGREMPEGHKHRFRVSGHYAGLPVLLCRCGKELVPRGRPRDGPPKPPVAPDASGTGFPELDLLIALEAPPMRPGRCSAIPAPERPKGAIPLRCLADREG